MAGGAFDVAQMICIPRITNPSLRSMTWLRCTKCLRADHLPGAGIEKVQREGTWGPCKKPISKKRTLLKITYKFARGSRRLGLRNNITSSALKQKNAQRIAVPITKMMRRRPH